jgi:hypothetical protein
LEAVLATKLLRVTAQRISTCVTRGDSHNRSPSPPADDAGAVQPVKEAGVQKGEKTSKDCQGRVLGVGHSVAAKRRPPGAAVAARRLPTAPSLWNGGGSDAARRSDSHDERNERLVEHHCGE